MTLYAPLHTQSTHTQTYANADTTVMLRIEVRTKYKTWQYYIYRIKQEHIFMNSTNAKAERN